MVIETHPSPDEGHGLPVTEEQVDAFRRDGFVVVPGLLSDEELDRLRPEVDAGVGRREARDGRSLAEKSRYEREFIQCINLWEDCDGVRPLTFHQGVAGAAARLLGVERLRIWHDQALYKEPGGSPTDGHQDAPYWPIAETDQITAWIPLDGSTLTSGAMGYVPGSHRMGVEKFVNIFGEEPPEDLLESEELQGRQPVFVEVPRGGVAFHHSLTFHVAKPNTTDGVRRVYTVIYMRDGCTRGTPRRHFSVDRAGIEVGAVIASEFTPVIWPRTDLPEPPPRPESSFGGALPMR